VIRREHPDGNDIVGAGDDDGSPPPPARRETQIELRRPIPVRPPAAMPARLPGPPPAALLERAKKLGAMNAGAAQFGTGAALAEETLPGKKTGARRAPPARKGSTETRAPFPVGRKSRWAG